MHRRKGLLTPFSRDVEEKVRSQMEDTVLIAPLFTKQRASAQQRDRGP